MARQELIPNDADAGAAAGDVPAVIDADELEDAIAQATTVIQAYQRRTVEGIAVIGSKIRDIKTIIPHGRFMQWVVNELGMSVQTAENMMRAAALVEQNRNYCAFGPTILYELAAPSTPEPVRQAVLNGQIAPTVERVKAARRAARDWPADAGDWTPADLDASDGDDGTSEDDDEGIGGGRYRSYATRAGVGATGADDDLWAILPVPVAWRKPLTVAAIAGGALLLLLLCWAVYAGKRGEGTAPTITPGPAGQDAGMAASAGPGA